MVVLEIVCLSHGELEKELRGRSGIKPSKWKWSITGKEVGRSGLMLAALLCRSDALATLATRPVSNSDGSTAGAFPHLLALRSGLFGTGQSTFPCTLSLAKKARAISLSAACTPCVFCPGAAAGHFVSYLARLGDCLICR